MISNQKFKVGQDPKFVGPDEIPLLPKFLTDQNPDQASHYHLLLKEWWESVYENLNRIRDMVVNFQVADLKEGTEGDITDAKNQLSDFTTTLVNSLDQEINDAINNLEGTLTQSITAHINNTNNPHGVTADQLNISNVGKTGDYSDLSDIPSEFNPSAHNHAISDVTNLQNSLDAKADSGDVFSGDYNDLTNKPSGTVLVEWTGYDTQTFPKPADSTLSKISIDRQFNAQNGSIVETTTLVYANGITKVI